MTNSTVCLTDNGVLGLYDCDRKTDINMQVVFLFFCDKNLTYYVRLSDGEHVSPIVTISEKHFTPTIYVGSVITIKVVRLENERSREFVNSLEDNDLPNLCIRSYILLECHKKYTSLLGSVNSFISYREAIRFVKPYIVSCSVVLLLERIMPDSLTCMKD
ncbi:hypothetical protein SK128_025953 [Halocaridina rubra]|uniref:Uncharacterized protein n=1 Tax=Halocaridina rubra TaxID=373956 RepID=A0AAN8ZX57_HALRR